MKILDQSNRELMTISAIQRDGDFLAVKGKIFGTMPMTAKLSPAEARAAFRLMDFRTLLFVLSLLFRRGAPRK